jgi:hypothetical protein
MKASNSTTRGGFARTPSLAAAVDTREMMELRISWVMGFRTDGLAVLAEDPKVALTTPPPAVVPSTAVAILAKCSDRAGPVDLSPMAPLRAGHDVTSGRSEATSSGGAPRGRRLPAAVDGGLAAVAADRGGELGTAAVERGGDDTGVGAVSPLRGVTTSCGSNLRSACISGDYSAILRTYGTRIRPSMLNVNTVGVEG